jgi:Protein kinase domain
MDDVTAPGPDAGAANDETQLATGSSPSAATGWLSSSGSTDHGRFPPGEVLQGRYRILGLLGRGGMGEVYRADDLRLGQPVALKFLPESLSRDSVRLAQFHNEVRTARQVSHPNVCRVYDIGDALGQLFLTMEHVDGEDLSSLLRRIGRLPEDKALEIARQICAGLAAAHERGVIHRDLKPANIMLDGTGKIRLLDFSLAAVGIVSDVIAGTPAYMAPEQLEGRETTVRSDIYALGLVLYELFTGRRAFDAKTLPDLVAQHASGVITSPSELVKALDETIERAILRCLEVDPMRRPASALAVAASLPGGDPLAAALAAGETPSPEMVAAAGGEQAMLSPLAGIVWVSFAAVALLSIAALADRTSLLARVPLSKPSAVLLDRAEEVRRSLGYSDAPVDRASGLFYDNDYLDWVQRNGSGQTQWRDLAEGRPPMLLFWYRTSPTPLVPRNRLAITDSGDPPVVIAGMTVLWIDTNGRLLSFFAVPPQVEKAPAAPGETDWRPLFAAAGLDPATFGDVPPARTPPSYADERRAWRGTLPGTKTPITIEAAGYRTRPVSFEVVGPWTKAWRDPDPEAAPDSRGSITTVIILCVLAAAVVLARRNIRSGRADRRGAFRVGFVMFSLLVGAWALLPHVADLGDETDRLFTWISLALFVGGAMSLLYLAIEPFVRRSWPTMLVGWSRALTGRIRDAVVGRDLVVGVSCGLALTVLDQAKNLIPRVLGWPEPVPLMPDTGVLDHTRFFVLTIMNSMNNGLQSALLTVMMFTLFREAVRRMAALLKFKRVSADYLAAGLALLLVTLVGILFNSDEHSQLWLVAGYQIISTVVFFVVLLRFGLLATVVMFTITALTLRMPLTIRPESLYFGTASVTLALVFAIVIVGLWMARAGEPMFAPSAQGSRL